jgi:hypothetical protein
MRKNGEIRPQDENVKIDKRPIHQTLIKDNGHCQYLQKLL